MQHLLCFINQRARQSWQTMSALSALFFLLFTAMPSAFSQTHVANPFSGATWYTSPDYANEINISIGQETDPILIQKMQTVKTYPTAVWMDRIAAINGTGGRLGLNGHLNAALQQQQGSTPIVVKVVIYDLPGRDCAALASNGELSINANPPTQPLSGLDTYKTQYIDPIVSILSNPAYANIRIVAVIEPDSVPNLVTNAGGGTTTIQACVDAKNSGVYVQGIQYAITRLHTIPNVYQYLDIGHSGWLGWPNNFSGAIQQYTTLVTGTPAGVNTIDGFVTDTANTLPTREPFMNASMTIGGQQLIGAMFYEFNPFIDEASYAQALYQNFVSAGFPSTIGMIIDTSRNGWGGAARPTGPSTSTDLNTFVNATKIDRRAHRGLWCNPVGAGIGTPPQANPAGFFPQLQAFVWIKPPGESDGTYLASLTPHPDPNCDPSKTNPLAGNTPTGAYPNSPTAGTFFPVQFHDLVNNAFPPIPTNTNPDFSLSSTSASMMQGATGTSTITVSPINSFSSSVALSVSGLPSGVTASFAPTSVAGGNGVSTLTFTAAGNATVGPATVTVTGTSGTLTHTTAVNLTVIGRPDFSLSLSPTSVTVPLGGAATSTITVGALFGFSANVNLSITAPPAGVTAGFNPSATNGAGTSTLTFNAQPTATGGTSTLTITGTSGALTHTVTLTLTVPGASDFSLSPTPASLSVAQGASGTSTITITRTGGFASAVSFTASGMPAGVTASFNPQTTTTTGTSSILTLSASATATPGLATVTITGTGGGVTHTTSVTLTVTNTTPDFSLAASPSTLSVNQGASGTSTITITRTNGFASAVSFTASGMPTGVTASFSPQTTTTTGTSSVLTLSASATATPGLATVTITGTGGGVTHTTSVALTVTNTTPDFSLAASPSTLSVNQGASGTSTITITRTNGFASAVSFTASGMPAGVTASFNPQTTTTTGTSSVLTLAASGTATLGAATVTITGTGGGLTHTVTIGLTVASTGGTGGVTITPVVSSSSPWFNEEQVRLANTGSLTALSITIVVQRTTGISFSGQYNTVGGQITQANSSTASTATYTYTLAPGQTLNPGSGYIFAAQTSGTGTAHPTAGDTYMVTYTTGGQNFTQSSHF